VVGEGRKMNVNFENSMWSEIYYCVPIFSQSCR